MLGCPAKLCLLYLGKEIAPGCGWGPLKDLHFICFLVHYMHLQDNPGSVRGDKFAKGHRRTLASLLHYCEIRRNRWSENSQLLFLKEVNVQVNEQHLLKKLTELGIIRKG